MITHKPVDIRRLLSDTLLILGMTAAWLVAVELVLRWAYPDPSATLRQEEIAYQFHPDYLSTLKPGKEKQYIRTSLNGGDTISWRSNQAGFRGPELIDAPEWRVMVYGDSNIQGRFSAWDSTYAGKLHAYLQLSTQWKGEVINAGIIGFGPDQSLIKMTGEVAQYRPDIVILQVFADNDFGDIIRNRLVTVDDSGALVLTSHPRTEDVRLTGQASQPLMLVRAAKKIGKSLFRQSPEAERADYIARMRQQCREEFAIYASGKPRAYSPFGDHYDFDLALEPDSPAAQTKIQLMTGVLKAAHALAQKQGFRLLVLIQPSSVDVSENNLISHLDLEKHPDYERARLSDCVETICRAARIPSLNLYPIFLANDAPSLFFREDDHWNDRGQDLAAQETARLLTTDAPFTNP